MNGAVEVSIEGGMERPGGAAGFRNRNSVLHLQRVKAGEDEAGRESVFVGRQT